MWLGLFITMCFVWEHWPDTHECITQTVELWYRWIKSVVLLQQSIKHVSIVYTCNTHFVMHWPHVIYSICSGHYLFTIYLPRCPVYSGLPDVCTLVKDPNDQCCMTPVCTLVSGNTLAPIYGNSTAPPTSLEVLPVGTHQVITGYGKPPVGSIYHSRSKCITFQSVYCCKTFFKCRCVVKKESKCLP